MNNTKFDLKRFILMGVVSGTLTFSSIVQSQQYIDSPPDIYQMWDSSSETSLELPTYQHNMPIMNHFRNVKSELDLNFDWEFLNRGKYEFDDPDSRYGEFIDAAQIIEAIKLDLIESVSNEDRQIVLDQIELLDERFQYTEGRFLVYYALAELLEAIESKGFLTYHSSDESNQLIKQYILYGIMKISQRSYQGGFIYTEPNIGYVTDALQTLMKAVSQYDSNVYFDHVLLFDQLRNISLVSERSDSAFMYGPRKKIFEFIASNHAQLVKKDSYTSSMYENLFVTFIETFSDLEGASEMLNLENIEYLVEMYLKAEEVYLGLGKDIVRSCAHHQPEHFLINFEKLYNYAKYLESKNEFNLSIFFKDYAENGMFGEHSYSDPRVSLDIDLSFAKDLYDKFNILKTSRYKTTYNDDVGDDVPGLLEYLSNQANQIDDTSKKPKALIVVSSDAQEESITFYAGNFIKSLNQLKENYDVYVYEVASDKHIKTRL